MKKVHINEILFAKTKEEAIIPSKRDCDAGYDVYACLHDDFMVIKPHEVELIPTGIATCFSTDYVAILKERGSTGTKNMTQHSGVIEGSFRGEWFCPIGNDNSYPIVLVKNAEVVATDEFKNMIEKLNKFYHKTVVYPTDKAIAQFIMVEVPKFKLKEIAYEELLSYESERGLGALGSSNK